MSSKAAVEKLANAQRRNRTLSAEELNYARDDPNDFGRFFNDPLSAADKRTVLWANVGQLGKEEGSGDDNESSEDDREAPAARRRQAAKKSSSTSASSTSNPSGSTAGNKRGSKKPQLDFKFLIGNKKARALGHDIKSAIRIFFVDHDDELPPKVHHEGVDYAVSRTASGRVGVRVLKPLAPRGKAGAAARATPAEREAAKRGKEEERERKKADAEAALPEFTFREGHNPFRVRARSFHDAVRIAFEPYGDVESYITDKNRQYYLVKRVNGKISVRKYTPKASDVFDDEG